MDIQLIFLFIFILIAFYTDIRDHHIPNLLNLVFMLTGLSYHLIDKGFIGLKFSIIGMVAGFVPFLLLYLFKAVGAGDVKLFATVGSLTGTTFVLYSAMYAIVYAGIIGLMIILVRKETRERGKRILTSFIYFFSSKSLDEFKEINKSKENLQFPFMYAVLPSIITTYYYFYIF